MKIYTMWIYHRLHAEWAETVQKPCRNCLLLLCYDHPSYSLHSTCVLAHEYFYRTAFHQSMADYDTIFPALRNMLGWNIDHTLNSLKTCHILPSREHSLKIFWKKKYNILTRFVFFPYISWLQPAVICYLLHWQSQCSPPTFDGNEAGMTDSKDNLLYHITRKMYWQLTWGEPRNDQLSLIFEFNRDHSLSNLIQQKWHLLTPVNID